MNTHNDVTIMMSLYIESILVTTYSNYSLRKVDR